MLSTCGLNMLKRLNRRVSDLRLGSGRSQSEPCLPSYHSNVIDHYENPRNVGSFDKTKMDVGTGLVGAPACGDVLKLQIKVDNSGKIIDSAFKTFGCGSAIASSSLASEWIRGLHIDDVDKISNRDIAEYLNLPPVKMHCASLSEDAIKAAIKDYKTKNNIVGSTD